MLVSWQPHDGLQCITSSNRFLIKHQWENWTTRPATSVAHTCTGIDVLNEAVDRLLQQVRRDRWLLCDVSVSPSTITIADVGGSTGVKHKNDFEYDTNDDLDNCDDGNDGGQRLAECRVRYLSFLGIGRDIKWGFCWPSLYIEFWLIISIKLHVFIDYRYEIRLLIIQPVKFMFQLVIIDVFDSAI